MSRPSVLITLGLAAVVIAVGVIVLRRWLARRALRDRVVVDLLPTTTFDPTLEDVVGRFAPQLARGRLTVAGLTPREGLALRVRIHTDAKGGQMGYALEGPARDASVLTHQSYAAVETRLRTAPETAPPAAEEEGPGGGAAEPEES